MARISVVLIRQLLGNRNHPVAAGFLHHLHDKPIQNLTSVPIPNTTSSSPHIIDIPSPTELFQLMRQGRYPSATLLSDSDSVSNILLSGRSNLFVIESLSIYYDALDKVKALKWITPIFDELREQFPHITMFKVYMDQVKTMQVMLCYFIYHNKIQIVWAEGQVWLIKEPNGPGSTLVDVFGVHRNMNITGNTLDKLGIQETPTFQCYLKGERVYEVAGVFAKHLKKRLENVYNPPGMKKRRRQGKEDDKDGGLVEVLPSRLPETSIQKVILELEQLIFDEDDQEDDLDDDLDEDDVLKDDQRHDQDKMWWFAKGLVSCEKKMKIFCKLKDPKAKLKWIKREMAKE
ncbi:uncharacterized protein Pyn_33488 [Prunus yedoensis var. nudiflora]|uniref:Uncharacterized protein n=1 Tax=Prunus yedoensis var. nudiflora TaxID=2094558 RepID=A0A314UE73_PRUYE|nr:uncharacterized protein Pyn_33488 [Prunus yedoensis var. nudiflora]